ncbi:BMP family protein [Rhizobium sp. ARZ01]|uniref:BMP family protein n=1 Tax=Rhizobium sp. ARZ01 TaxID=2769313 RepID=UPI00177FAE0B|nr:BMP family protein [Rhizobium sp. ARZ01]MBD9375444.1 BMP family protein [Rhizobium sp. ARZ01]
MKKLLSMFVVASMAFAVGAHAETKRIALVLPGPITDGTFNSAANKGIEAAKKKYDIEVAVRENTDFAQMEEVLRSYADDDYDMVIAHGFQFGEAVLAVHNDYPETFFVVNTAQVSAAPNVASFDNRWGDAGYIAGAVAALYSKSGKIGTIGAIAVPVIEQYNLGFERGAKHMKPETKVLSAYVGSFTDVARGAEITTSLIEQGADVVTSTGNENVMGTIQAAQKAKVKAIGSAFDSYQMAPDTIITTALINMDVNIDLAIGRFIEGKLKPESYVLGLNDGGIGLAPLREFENQISAEDKARIDALIADIAVGRIKDLP